MPMDMDAQWIAAVCRPNQHCSKAAAIATQPKRSPTQRRGCASSVSASTVWWRVACGGVRSAPRLDGVECRGCRGHGATLVADLDQAVPSHHERVRRVEKRIKDGHSLARCQRVRFLSAPLIGGWPGASVLRNRWSRAKTTRITWASCSFTEATLRSSSPSRFGMSNS